MHFTPLDKKARAEWQGMLNPADGARIGAAAVLFLCSALVLPFSRVEAVAGLYLLYAVVFYYMLTRSIASVAILAAPGMLLFGISALAPGLPHPYLMPAVYAALILGGVGGSFLLIHCREKKYLPLLAMPVVAYVLAAVLVGPLQGLWVLIPVALSLVLGHGMLTCRPQTPVLLSMAAVLAVAGVVTYLIWYGLFSLIPFPAPDPLTYLGVLLREGVARVSREAMSVYAEAGVELMLSDTDIYNVGAVLGNVLPGFFLAGCGILAFLIYRTHLRVLTSWGTLSRVPLRVGAMTVSPIAAGIFLFTYLAGMIASGNLFGTVCENIAFVLEPALVLVGVSALLARDPAKRSALSLILLVGVLVLLFNFPTLALGLAAVVGAIRILLAAFFAAKGKGAGKDNK